MCEKMNDTISSHNTNNQSIGRHYLHLKVPIPIIFLLIILFFSAWVRFDGITEQGVALPADCFVYVKEAKLWATGQPPKFLGGRFYRPVSYFLQGMAIRIFGDNDYSIKLFHGIMDMLSIILIFMIASILARDYWAGALSSLIYAFLPGVVKLVRSEMLHVESTFFVLLSLFFFILFVSRKTGKGVKLFLLAMAGLSIGFAANTHADQAFLAPGYVLYLFIKSYDSQNKKKSLKKFVITAFIFTFSFFTPYLLGFLMLGPKLVLQVFLKEMTIAKYTQIAHLGHASEPTIFFNIIYYSIKHYFGKQIFFIGVLLIGTNFIMIYRKIKKESDSLLAYTPIILIFSYSFFHSLFLYTSPQPRLLMPLLSLFIFIITQWYYKIFKQLFGKYYLIVFICLFSMLFLLNPKVLPGEPKYKVYIRSTYDILEDDVNSKNKLLITPVIIAPHIGFNWDLYFGKNAIYLWKLHIKKEYNLKSLEALLKDKNIRYIYLGKRIHGRVLKPNFHISRRFRGWLRNEKFQYSLEKDLEIIQAYIRNKGGLVIHHDYLGDIYYLTGEKLVQKPGLIDNGSFEHWRKGFPMGRWKQMSGRISRSGEATSGSCSVCFKPGNKKGTQINWIFPRPVPLPFLKHGGTLRAQLDAKAGKSHKFTFFFTAIINGKRQRIEPGLVRYKGNGDWITLTQDFAITTGMKNLMFCLRLQAGAREPAFVDNLSIIVKD